MSSYSMAVESHLEIPKELAAILASVDAQEYGCPVWSFSKHNSGYSLKLFWKSEHFKPSPNKALRKFLLLSAMQMPYLLVLLLALLAQTKLFSALQTPVALDLFLRVLLAHRYMI